MGAGRQRGIGDRLMKGPPDEGLRPLLRSLRKPIEQARQQVLRVVDTVQVQTCWEIGRHIVELNKVGRSGRPMGSGCSQPWPRC
jgi:hypothetical protein